MSAAVVDCDVHLPAPAPATLLRCMPEHWRDQYSGGGFRGIETQLSSIYPSIALATPDVIASMRAAGKASAPGDEAAAGYLSLLRERALARPNVSAIANCYTGVEGVRQPYMAADIARAVNEWVASVWLAAEPRLRGGIVITPQFVDFAVAEIERLAQDRRFVQVLLPARSLEPYGSRRYWPIFKAAATHGLVIALHFGGIVGIPPTSSGWPSYYVEEHVGMSPVFQTQVTSLAVSGVFEEYPELRIALCEGGFTWVPSIMWQLDKRWKGLRRDTPWVKRAPSEYIRSHMRATLQPADLPPTAGPLANILEYIGTDGFLMYATDFPHPHASTADQVVALLPPAMRPGIMSATASAFYHRPLV